MHGTTRKRTAGNMEERWRVEQFTDTEYLSPRYNAIVIHQPPAGIKNTTEDNSHLSF